MAFALHRSAAFWLLVAAPLLGAAKPPQKKDVTPQGPGAARQPVDAKVLEVADRPLDDAEVARFLRLWPAFEAAMDRAAPPVPKATGLDAAETAWEADRRLEQVLQEAGASSEEFLALYRRVSSAWWSLLQREQRERAEAALSREIAELERVAGQDNPAAKEMRAHAGRRTSAGSGVPQASLDAVARKRADLARIFGGP